VPRNSAPTWASPWQIINILVEQNEKRSLALLRSDDILILPQLGDFSAADFNRWTVPIALGEAAARKLSDRLAKLSLPAEDYAALLASRCAAWPADTRRLDEVRLPPLSRVNPEVVRAQLQTQAGQPPDLARLEADVRRLYASGDFESVGYALIDDAGRRVVAIDAVEKSWGPNFLQFGLQEGADFRGESRFETLAAYRRTWINSLGAEWRTDLQLGHQDRLSTEWYQPLDIDQLFFVAPYGELDRSVLDVFADSERVASYVLHEGRGGLDLGARLGRAGELRIGMLAARIRERLDEGPVALAPGPEQVGVGAWRLRLRADEYDRVVAPRWGFQGSAGLFASRAALGGQSSYTKWDVGGSAAQSVGDSTLDLGMTFKGRFGFNDIPRYDVSQWGGFLHLSGYRIDSLDGQSLQFARAIYRYRLAQLPLLNGIYTGLSLEAGRLGRPIVASNPTDTMKSASAFFLLDSPIGPLYLAYGRARDGNWSFYLYLGQP
jgi:NTE family protein